MTHPPSLRAAVMEALYKLENVRSDRFGDSTGYYDKDEIHPLIEALADVADVASGINRETTDCGRCMVIDEAVQRLRAQLGMGGEK